MGKNFATVSRGEIGLVTVSPRRILDRNRQPGAVEERTGAGSIRLLRPFVNLFAAAILVSLSACSFQTGSSDNGPQAAPITPATPAPKPANHAKKADAKPEPSKQDLFAYVRGKLLSLSPVDGINDNLEVVFDPDKSVLSVTQPDGHCDIFLGGIDSNSAIWEVIDPSETNLTRPEILRLTLNSLSGRTARICYDKKNQIDVKMSSNRARLLFDHAKANAIPNFTYTMDKAIKKLVAQSGGAPEKALFDNH